LTYQQLRRWLIDVWRWLAEAKLIFMGTLVVLIVTLFGFVAWRSEESIRIAGYSLQFMGMIFAVRGLLKVREHFGQPLLRQLAFQWLKRFPRWKRNVVIGVGTAHLGMAGIKGRAEAWNPDDPEKPIEQRIEAIIKNLDRVREEQRKHTHSIDKLKESHEEHKKQVAEEQNNMKKTIRSDLESLHTSDLITSLVGLVWLTVGITMSTLAPELSQWLYLS
jgi:hypothetical protein